MKEITAVIRQNKMNVTKRALADMDVPCLTACRALGRGRGQVEFQLVRDVDGHEDAIELVDMNRLISKRILTIVVPDEKAGHVVETIIAVNQTGNAGDGKIFVQSVGDAFRIRTGEQGDAAIG